MSTTAVEPRTLADLYQLDRQIVEPMSEEARRRPYLSLEHVESHTGVIDRCRLGGNGDAGTGATFAFDSRHVLYGKLRPYLNKVATPDFEGRCTTEIIPLLPRPGVDREYLAWLLRSPGVVAAASRQTSGSRMPRADMDELGRVAVRVPSFAAQRRIAAQLTAAMAVVERARTAARDRLAAAEALSTAYIRESFDDRIVSTWPRRRIADIAETCSGATPPRANPRYFGGGIPWVKTGELRDGLVCADGETEETVSEEAVVECSLPRLPAGTLLVAMYGQGKTRGRTGLLAREATTNQACFAILPNPTVFDSTFLQYWFRANYNRLREMTEGRGGNQPNLNGVLLRALEVPLPPVRDQQHIAANLAQRLANTAMLTQCLRAELDAVNSLSNALLREAFGGLG